MCPNLDERSCFDRSGLTLPQMQQLFDELVATGPLTVAFQAIVSLDSGAIFGYEVLGRCGPHVGGLANLTHSPTQLLDAAHACGRLLALDRRWRALAMETIARVDEAEPIFFLNVDPRVSTDPEFAPGFTRRLTERWGLAPSRFVLELTEVVEPTIAIEQVLHAYAAQGFGIAIDDLGASGSSLSRLLRLQPRVVKLDAQLVRGIDADARRAQLVRAFAEFAARTGTLLVAEAIETEAELRAVRAAGVQLGQGFLLARPAAAPAALDDACRQALHRTAPRATAELTVDRMTELMLQLVSGMTATSDLDSILQHVTSTTSKLIDADRVSVRLLDDSRQRLLVAARSGPSLHEDERVEFRVGEGLLGWIVAEKQSLRIARADEDARFVRKGDMRGTVGSFLGVPLLDADGCIGVLAVSGPTRGGYSAADQKRLELIAGLVLPHLQVGRLRHLAHTDPLTCLLNRHALDQVLPELPPSEDMPLSLVALDIDHFKSINDRFGHAAGDAALRVVADAISSVVRRADRVMRTGGEEFLLVLPGVSEDGAALVAERARACVAAAAILPGQTVTISAGVVERLAGERRDHVIARADAAMYRAKDRGRNRVERDFMTRPDPLAASTARPDTPEPEEQIGH